MKFQMNIDEKPIRTIEELQENFNIDEILDLYEDGTFEKWLSSRNHIKELEKLREIKSKEEKEIILKLIEIFEIDKDEETLKKALLYRNYRKEKKDITVKLLIELSEIDRYEKMVEKALLYRNYRKAMMKWR